MGREELRAEGDRAWRQWGPGFKLDGFLKVSDHIKAQESSVGIWFQPTNRTF